VFLFLRYGRWIWNDIREDIMTRKEKAMEKFLEGYNCSQSILLAFEDMITIDIDTALKIASPYGGGMGRLREVCGSVSGMFMVLGYLIVMQLAKV
jgi:hypothetical protein